MKELSHLSFRGKATRSQFWGWHIFSYVWVFGVIMLNPEMISSDPMSLTLVLVLLGAAWIMLSTAVRRSNDMDISPWFALLLFIPYVAVIMTLVWGMVPSKSEEPKVD